MTKNAIKDDLKLQAFPEDITADGVKVYGKIYF
jgi:hypothetical protein